jgi:hypothetical protein
MPTLPANTTNNSASDADRVQGLAAITITKTNNTTTPARAQLGLQRHGDWAVASSLLI